MRHRDQVCSLGSITNGSAGSTNIAIIYIHLYYYYYIDLARHDRR